MQSHCGTAKKYSLKKPAFLFAVLKRRKTNRISFFNKSESSYSSPYPEFSSKFCISIVNMRSLQAIMALRNLRAKLMAWVIFFYVAHTFKLKNYRVSFLAERLPGLLVNL